MDIDTIKDYYEKNPEGIPPLPEIGEIYEMHKLIKQHVQQLKPKRLLDAGCGKGYTGKSVLKYCKEYYGFDLSSTAVKIAQKRLENGNFEVGSITKLPYENEYFDCVICSEVLEHIPNYKIAISELSRVTRFGKNIIVTLPNRINPDMKWRLFWKGQYTSQIYDNPPHYRFLSKEFKNYDLEIIDFCSFFYLPLFGESIPKLIRPTLMKFLEIYSQIINRPKGLYLFYNLKKIGQSKGRY